MNKLTLTLTALLLAGGAFCADPPGEKPKEKSPAEVLYEKLLEANTKEADKAYAAYLKALEVANGKILAGLEAAKKDLNDPKKGKLSIVERAAAIAEIDAKILEVKKNGVGEAVVAGRSGDLLGEGNPDLAKAIVGKWDRLGGGGSWIFNADGSGIHIAGGEIIISWVLSDPNVYMVSLNGAGPDRKIVITKDRKEALEVNGASTVKLVYTKQKQQ